MSGWGNGMAEETAAGLLRLRDLDVLPRSVVSVAGAEFGLARPGPRLVILGPSGSPRRVGRRPVVSRVDRRGRGQHTQPRGEGVMSSCVP